MPPAGREPIDRQSAERDRAPLSSHLRERLANMVRIGNPRSGGRVRRVKSRAGSRGIRKSLVRAQPGEPTPFAVATHSILLTSPVPITALVRSIQRALSGAI